MHAVRCRCDRPSALRLVGQHLLAAMLVAAGVLLVARLAAAGFSDMLPGSTGDFARPTPVLTAMVAMIYLLSIAMHYVVIEAQNSRRSELLAREAQLRALKAQVNPHFLFNSLNSISALTASDASRAREMCIRLADFLRTSLQAGRTRVDTVPGGDGVDTNVSRRGTGALRPAAAPARGHGSRRATSARFRRC